MNLLQCRRCGADVKAGPHATNKRFCSTDCYDTWWNEHRSRHLTQTELVEAIFGPKPKVEFDDVKAAWFAALVDGEGSIGIWREWRHRKRIKGYWSYRPVIQVTNSNRDLLHQLQANVEGYGHTKNLRRRNPNHKPTFAVSVNTRAVPDVLNAIKRYLIAKRGQAEVVLEFCRVKAAAPVRASQDADLFEALYLQCKALNKRGV